MDALAIESSRGVYEVHFETDLRALAQKLATKNNIVVVGDEKVISLYGTILDPLLSVKPWLSISATEDEKTLRGCEKILGFLIKNNANRETQIVALGGGIVQDLVTLCAHIYFRGISWIFIPTTLLAMADSCVGAKASINFEGYKNQLGVFHSPGEVYICAEFLKSLPPDEVRSGYGEIFKLHFASSPARFLSLAEKVETRGWVNDSITAIIRDSLEIKKDYIEKDEFDAGVRKHLNFGHTFGHALESITDHRVPHGLAIAWGMDLINFLAMRSKRIDEQLFSTTHSTLKKLFYWRLDRSISVQSLVEATKRDKKSTAGRLNLVMPGKEGRLEMVSQEYSQFLVASIAEYLSQFSIIET